MQDPSRVRPPTRILDPFRVEEEQVDATVRKSAQVVAAVLLPQFDALSPDYSQTGLNEKATDTLRICY
jgi:hypothetical protein